MQFAQLDIHAKFIHNFTSKDDCIILSRTEFQQLIDYWDGYCITLKETEERVALKEEEWGDMSQRIPVLEVQEAAVNDLVSTVLC